MFSILYRIVQSFNFYTIGKQKNHDLIQRFFYGQMTVMNSQTTSSPTANKTVDTTKLLYEVVQMRQDIQSGRTDINYIDKYSYLYLGFPSLFQLIQNNRGDYMPVVMTMLDKAEKINKGLMTHESASKDIGETLAEKYIYPKIDMSKETGIKV